MRVLILSGSGLPIHCGISDYTDHLVRQLLQRGIETRVVTHVDAAGSDVVHNVIDRWSIGRLPQIFSEVRSFAPDVLHFMYPSVKFSRGPFVNVLPHFLKMRFHSLPLVITLHEYHNASALGKARVLLTAAAADLLVVTNAQDAAALRRFRARRLLTIPQGNHFPVQEHTRAAGSELRRKYGLPTSNLVGFVGFIDPAKGVERLLVATSRLRQRPALLFLSTFDTTNIVHRDLRRLADTLGVELYWPGYLTRQEVSLLIQECQMMVFPFLDPVSARRSTFITALLHGRPTIATGVDSAPFVGGRNCILLQKMTPEALTEAMQRLQDDAQLRERLGEEGRKLQSVFNWSQNGESHAALYEELLTGSAART